MRNKLFITGLLLAFAHLLAAQPRVRQFEIPIANPYGEVQSIIEWKGAWYGNLSTPCQYRNVNTFCDTNFKISGDSLTSRYVDSMNSGLYGLNLHRGRPVIAGQYNGDSLLQKFAIYEFDESLNAKQLTRFYPSDTFYYIVPSFHISHHDDLYIFSNRYLFFREPKSKLGSQPWVTKLDSNYQVEWEKPLPVPPGVYQSYPEKAMIRDNRIVFVGTNHLGAIIDRVWNTITIEDDGTLSNFFDLDTFTSLYNSANFTLTKNGDFVLSGRSILPEEIIASSTSDTMVHDSWYIKRMNRRFKELWRLYVPVASTYKVARIETMRNGDILVFGTLIHIQNVPPYREQWYPWVARFTENGQLLWTRIIENNTRPLEPDGIYGYLNCGFEASDKRIIVGGTYAPQRLSKARPWVYELDSMGCLTPGCSGFRQIIHPDGTVTSVDEPAGSFQLQQGPFYVYPNPIQESFTFENTTSSPVQLQVFNLQGQMISSHVGLGQGIHRLSLPPTLAPGVYVWQAVGKNGVLQSGKLQKE